MKKEYLEELKNIVSKDLGKFAYYQFSTNGIPLEMAMEKLEENNLLDQIILCTGFRKEHGNLMGEDPYRPLNVKYFGEPKKMTYEEFIEENKDTLQKHAVPM